MRIFGNPRRLAGRLTREAATTALAVVMGLGGWLFGPADTIAVIVPGVDNRLDNFETGYAGRQRRAPAWQARQLYQQVRADDRTAHVAVVAWLGYDPPEGIGRAAMREERARAGAAALT